MSEPNPQPATAQGSIWRFGLRDMLAAVAVLGVYFAALVLSFRGLSPIDVQRLAIVSAACSVGGMVAIGINVWMHRRAARAAVFLLRREPPGLVWCLGAIAPPLALLWLSSAWEAIADFSFAVRLGIVIGIAMTGCLAIWTLWQRSLTLSESGIVVDRAFHTPWHRLRSAGWKLDESGRIRFGQGWGSVSALVPPEQHANVAEFVRAKLG